MHNKKSRPVLEHQGGKGKTFIIILPLLRGAVKAACVTLGFYIAAAAAALNLPALLAGTLALNAALGIYFNFGGMAYEDVQRL